MFLCDFLHDLHHQLVVIGRDVGGGEDRCQLVLCRSNFVMLCLSKYTQLPEFFIEILHVSGYSRLDGSEVMIFELLALRCFCSEKCSSCINKIFSLIIELYRNEEVFLLRSYCSSNCEMRIGVTEES